MAKYASRRRQYGNVRMAPGTGNRYAVQPVGRFDGKSTVWQCKISEGAGKCCKPDRQAEKTERNIRGFGMGAHFYGYEAKRRLGICPGSNPDEPAPHIFLTCRSKK